MVKVLFPRRRSEGKSSLGQSVRSSASTVPYGNVKYDIYVPISVVMWSYMLHIRQYIIITYIHLLDICMCMFITYMKFP